VFLTGLITEGTPCFWASRLEFPETCVANQRKEEVDLFLNLMGFLTQES
jgi:hypothetical protein